METLFLKCSSPADLVTGWMGKYAVIGPVAKGSQFVFAPLANAGELRLDYTTTILPPKKVFFPTRQDLLKFEAESYTDCIDPKEKVLLGVHPHDVMAIAMSDKFYSDNLADNNYLANRRATIIVASNVQKHYEHAFFGSACAGRSMTGHDVFMTRTKDGYLFECLTERGFALPGLADLPAASAAQIAEAEEVNRAANEACPQKLNSPIAVIEESVRAAYDSDVWAELSEDCFSCGSCNTVCPTCYCFDVQDEWNLDGKSGTRYRTWDGCLTAEFSQVSVQGGCENFRETRAQRFRHRIMRKAVYLNEQLGGLACVGCGRCSGACTAGIAAPPTVINKLTSRKEQE